MKAASGSRCQPLPLASSRFQLVHPLEAVHGCPTLTDELSDFLVQLCIWYQLIHASKARVQAAVGALILLSLHQTFETEVVFTRQRTSISEQAIAQ